MGCDQSSDIRSPRKINAFNRAMFNTDFADTTILSEALNNEGNFFDPIIPIFDEINKS